MRHDTHEIRPISPIQSRLLQHKLQTSLAELDQLCVELQESQTSLEHFLVDYYQQVGSYFEWLNALRQTRGAAGPPEEGAFEICPDGLEEISVIRKHYDRELKSLYYQLARACHPDMQLQKDDGQTLADRQETMKLVNHAYQHRNLSSLWKLAQDIASQPNSGQHLLEQSRQIAELLSTARDALTSLRESPAWKLMERVTYARFNGVDLISQVIENVREEIRQEQASFHSSNEALRSGR